MPHIRKHEKQLCPKGSVREKGDKNKGAIRNKRLGTNSKEQKIEENEQPKISQLDQSFKNKSKKDITTIPEISAQDNAGSVVVAAGNSTENCEKLPRGGTSARTSERFLRNRVVSRQKYEHHSNQEFIPNNMGLSSNIGEVLLPTVTDVSLATLPEEEAIAACLPCLEANETYICTPCNPRCYIIQKVTSASEGNLAVSPVRVALNPEAVIFETSKDESVDVNYAPDTSDLHPPVDTSTTWSGTKPCYAFMNGDVGKLPSGAVCATPETPDISSVPDVSVPPPPVNGLIDEINHYDEMGSEITATGAPDGTPSESANDPSTIPLDQLKQMLSSQLEYYFSRENLANDTYLLSQMDNDQYVPIWTVANFNQVKKLTTDISLITQVLRDSPNVQVDEEGLKVRPNHKRCIVILREIPDSTPLEEVKNLFVGDGCPKVISCEFAHNNSWYVTFESDEDAQKAYRFLREEVKEFQGRPIMARIKAKPMNRLPITTPGGAASAGAPTLKNGFRSPPGAVFDPATGVFQNPGQPPPQRFIYSNGSAIPTAVNYSNPSLHVYTFSQANQPFYPPPMLQPWGAANTYFDIGSVFTVNGLAPQQSFSKPVPGRFVPRTSRGNKRASGSDRGAESPTPRTHIPPPPLSSLTPIAPVALGPLPLASPISIVSSKQSPQPHTIKMSEVNHSKENDSIMRLSDSLELGFRPKDKSDSLGNAAAERHRRRRKEDEGRSTPPGGPLVAHANHFDLEATAFPPLPAGTVLKTVSVETETVTNHWGESRLADVVKGTVKHKTTPTGTKEDGGVNVNGGASSAAVSPHPPPSSPKPPLIEPSTKLPDTEYGEENVPRGENKFTELPSPAAPIAAPSASFSCDADTSTNATQLTPPSSPLRVAPLPKCLTADKATKTDDILLNGDLERADKLDKTGAARVNKNPKPAKPATTNAATMTSSVIAESEPAHTIASTTAHPDLAPRLSYAQVTQHPKDKEKCEKQARERTTSESEKDKSKEGSIPRETKERRDEGFREVSSRSSGRGGLRSSTAGTGAARRTRDARDPSRSK